MEQGFEGKRPDDGMGMGTHLEYLAQRTIKFGIGRRLQFGIQKAKDETA